MTAPTMMARSGSIVSSIDGSSSTDGGSTVVSIVLGSGSTVPSILLEDGSTPPTMMAGSDSTVSSTDDG